jgi:hypothetical protein
VHSMPRGAWCPVSEVRALSRQSPDTNFGNRGGASNTMIPVPLFDFKFPMRIRGGGAGTSNPQHWK